MGSSAKETFSAFQKQQLSNYLLFLIFLLYKEVGRVAICSSLVLTLPNGLHEKEWLDNCSIHFKPMINERYVDDIFFSSKKHPQLFVDCMNKQHKYLTFISEAENDNSFSFLDIKITHYNKQFQRCVYRKPTFSGVLTYYESYFDQTCKKSLIDTYYFLAFQFPLAMYSLSCHYSFSNQPVHFFLQRN